MEVNEIIKELEEELLNKEITLLEMDNEAQAIIGNTNSISDHADEIKQDGSMSYYIEEDKNIIIEYLAEITDEEIEKIRTSEDDEDNQKFLNIKVKVTNIWED